MTNKQDKKFDPEEIQYCDFCGRDTKTVQSCDNDEQEPMDECEECGKSREPKQPRQDGFIEEIMKKFDNVFNSCGYDHVDTCTCAPFEKCRCESGRSRLKSILFQAMRTAVDACTLKENPIFSGPDGEDHAAHEGYDAAISHQNSLKSSFFGDLQK